MSITFGDFIKEKRIKKDITLRGFAKLTGISPVYASNIERGDRSAPTYDILLSIARVLTLSESEKERMFDLAAESKNSVSLAPDLLNYINENEEVHKVLRIANRMNASPNDWKHFEDYLKNNRT